MFMVLGTATADENLSKGAPVARPSTSMRGQRCRTPEASGTADLIKHRAAGLFSPQSPMAPLWRCPRAHDNRLARAPLALALNGKKDVVGRSPEATGPPQPRESRAAAHFHSRLVHGKKWLYSLRMDAQGCAKRC